MAPEPIESLDEILRVFGTNVVVNYEANQHNLTEYKAVYIAGFKEAKQALEALIAERERLARIDEIKQLADEYLIYISKDEREIQDRLAQLKEQQDA